MFKKYLNWYYRISAVIIAVLVFSLGFYIGSERTRFDHSEIIEDKSAEVDVIPVLVAPLKYFEYSNITSGSAGGEYPNWDSARFDNGFRSFPTTTILFKDYSSETLSLPSIPSDEKWKELIDENFTVYAYLYKEQFDELGDLGKRFASEGLQVSGVEDDVTGDGKPEFLLSLGDVGGNHQPYYYKIVQDNKIIFEAGKETVQLMGLHPDPTGNGFTLSWSDDKHFKQQGLCCSLGNYSTRFIYRNGTFEPLYEQEELYFEVKNNEYNEK